MTDKSLQERFSGLRSGFRSEMAQSGAFAIGDLTRDYAG
jgi:hypothetical protein